jgi:hypothetical protein
MLHVTNIELPELSLLTITAFARGLIQPMGFPGLGWAFSKSPRKPKPSDHCAEGLRATSNTQLPAQLTNSLYEMLTVPILRSYNTRDFYPR